MTLGLELHEELERACARTPDLVAGALGLPAGILWRAGGLARAWGVAQTEGRFRFADPTDTQTQALWIVGVYADPPSTAGAAGDRDGLARLRDGLIDLVAWADARPDRFRLRRGLATWLNESALERALGALAEDLPAEAAAAAKAGDDKVATIRLYRTPLDWLQAGAPDDGAVALRLPSHSCLRWELDRHGIGRVLVDDRAFAGEVYKKLRRTPRRAIPAVWAPAPGGGFHGPLAPLDGEGESKGASAG